MKVFDNLAAMLAVLTEGACAPTRLALSEFGMDGPGATEQASFTALFGYPLYLIEEVEELRFVLSFEEIDGCRRSLADDSSGAFDVAEWVDDGRFARFVTIESGEGGPQYLVPRAVADRQQSVAESIKLFECALE